MSEQTGTPWRVLSAIHAGVDAKGEQYRICLIEYRGEVLTVSGFEYPSDAAPPADCPDSKSFEVVADGRATAELAPVWVSGTGMEELLRASFEAGVLDAATYEEATLTEVA